ncbi:hypothetical protein [Bacillus swezeyi]|uniref:hypothetical protein n=1 Tax=Bacillus swezeyi TaxID=1925020 RepID=UPI003F88DCB2
MRRIKLFKSFVSMLTAVLLVSFCTSGLAKAQEVDFSASELKEINKISEELKFYFEEVGEVDSNGVYRIKNMELLKERSQAGDTTATNVLEIYQDTSVNKESHGISTRSAKAFAKCVVGKFQESYGYIARGFLTGAVYKYIKNKQWDLAARLMFKTLRAAGFKANIAGLAAEAAIYGFQCRGKW